MNIEKPLLSVIIPVYNSINYIDKCISSVCNQTYKNLEIIIVDDGSFDGTGDRLVNFANRDSRIKLIKQVNAGESNARNVGLSYATGDYIALVDCDDWIDADMYNNLIEVAQNNPDVDLILSSWFWESENDTIEKVNKGKVKNGIINQEELMRCVYERDSYQGFAYMWNKIYKRSLFYNENKLIVRFDEKLKLGGDVLALAEILLRVKKAIYVNAAYYHYVQHGASGCHTRSISKLLDWIKAYEITLEKFEEYGVDEEITIWVKRFMAYHCSNVLEVCIEENDIKTAIHLGKIMIKYQNEYLDTNKEYPERITRYCNLVAEVKKYEVDK